MADTLRITDSQELIDILGTMQSDDTIEIQSDIQLDDRLIFDKTCVVNLNGHTISFSTSQPVTVKSKAKVTFRNGTITGTADDLMYVSGDQSMLTLADDLIVDAQGTAVNVSSKGKLCIEGATLTGHGKYPTVSAKDKGSSVDMKDGSVISERDSGVVVRKGATLLVSQNCRVVTSCVEGNLEGNHPAVLASDTSTDGTPAVVVITGGPEIISEFTSALILEKGAQCTLENGTLMTNSMTHDCVVVSGQDTTFRMVGGQITSSHTNGISVVGLSESQTCVVDVVGGKIDAPEGAVVSSEDSGSPDILVDGITFSGTLDDKYVKAGFDPKDGQIINEPSDGDVTDVEPTPEPEPEPEVEPLPEPDADSGQHSESVHVRYTQSIALIEPINVYIGPSLDARSNSVIGAIMLSGQQTVDAYGNVFEYVSYKLPGNGSRVFGFVLERDVK